MPISKSKNKIAFGMNNPTFHVVKYTKYPVTVVQYRVTIPRDNGINLMFEAVSWSKLFDLIESFYPGLKYEIPDEIETITY